MTKFDNLCFCFTCDIYGQIIVKTKYGNKLINITDLNLHESSTYEMAFLQKLSNRPGVTQIVMNYIEKG